MGERVLMSYPVAITVSRRTALVVAVLLATPSFVFGQNGDSCRFICELSWRVEPTITIENLANRHRLVIPDGVTERVNRERVFELVLALDMPTKIPWLGFTVEAIASPFSEDNDVELEFESNFHWLTESMTRGWVTSHFDVVDQFSPADRPDIGRAYTHKLDFEPRMTASAIYAPPFTAEAYDEPLEDAIRLRGKGFPQSTTNARGDFVIANVPDGRYFIHVTPGPADTEHLPGGDRSRQSYAASDIRGQSMTITVSSHPSANARFVGSSACLACHKDKQHWQQTAHKLGWTAPDAPGKMQDFSRHPQYFDAMRSFPAVDDYRRGTRLELGDYDASRGDDKFKLRAFGDTRLPIETTYADVYLWKNAGTGKYFITMVNRLNAQDANSRHTWKSSFSTAVRCTTSATSSRSPRDWASVRVGTQCCDTT